MVYLCILRVVYKFVLFVLCKKGKQSHFLKGNLFISNFIKNTRLSVVVRLCVTIFFLCSTSICQAQIVQSASDDQINTQIIYPSPAVCATSNDLMIPQIVGRTGGIFSANTGLQIDSTTGAINPSLSASGEYTIRYFIAPDVNDPGVDVTVFVSIIAPPTVAVVANRNSVCEGDTLFLSASAVSTSPNDNPTFSWSGPNDFNGISSDVFVPMFNSGNAGVYSVIVTSSVLQGCSTTRQTDFIQSAPSPLEANMSGDASVCAGSAAHLYINISGGNAPYKVAYNNGPGTAVDTIDNYDGFSAITRELNSTTTFNLLGVSSAEGCPVLALDTTPLVVNVIPALTATMTASGASTICRGATTGLKVDITGASGGSYTIVYSNGTQQTTINNYVSGSNISVYPLYTTTYHLLRAELNGAAAACATTFLNTAVTIIVNQPVSFSDLYVSTSNPICGGANYRANLKMNLTGGKVPFTVGISAGGVVTNYIYDTTSSVSSQRAMSVRPTSTTLYRISSITDGNGCSAVSSGLGDTATVYVIPTATSNSGIYVRNLASYRNICAGSNAKPYVLIYRYTGNAVGTVQDYTNRYTIILSVKVNGVLMRYDTIRNYLNRTEIQIPTNMIWSGSLELGLVKIINSLNCAVSNFSTSLAPQAYITMQAAAIPGNITGSSQVCAGTNTTRIELNNYSGTIQWYQSATENGTYQPISGATDNFYIAENLSNSRFYKALLTNNTCTNYSGVASVVVSPTPQVGAILGTDTVCMGSDASVLLTNATGSISWHTSTDGIQFTEMPNDTGIVLDIPSIQNSAYYQAKISSGVCPAVYSDIHHIVVNDPGLWVGPTTDERWDNPNNWACGRVPDSNTNVTILPASINDASPMIGANSFGESQIARVKNINVVNGATLNITENSVLQISGEILGDGTIDSRDGNIEMVGSADTQYLSPARFMYNTLRTLKVGNAGGVLSISGDTDTLRVSEKIIFGTSNATLKTNDRLVLVSNANGTASVGDMTSDGINTGVFEGNRIIGNVTVERYIPEHYKAWQFLSAPAIGQTIKQAWQEGNDPLGNARQGYGTIITSNVPNAVANGYDIQSPGSSFKTYQSSTNTWVNVPSTNQLIENTKGYMLFVRGDRSVTSSSQSATPTTLRMTGTLYTPLDNPPAEVNIDADRFEAIGNPYASAIDFSKLQKIGGVQDAFYVWDPRLTNTPNGNYGFGAYQTFVGVGDGYYRVIPGGGSYGDPGTLQRGNIQSGQAFFVRTEGNNGSLNFSESSKVMSNATVTRSASYSTPRISINLSMVNAGDEAVLIDGTMVETGTEFSNTLDVLDIRKLANNTENVSILSCNTQLLAERRRLVNTEDTIWLSLSQLRNRNYRLEILPESFESDGREARFCDLLNNTITNIIADQKTTINFTGSTTFSSFSNRFCIVLGAQRNTLPVKISQISAIRKSEVVEVSWKTEQEVMIDKYIVERSMDGKNFVAIGSVKATNQSGVRSYSITDAGAGSTKLYYRVRILDMSLSNSLTEIVHVKAISNSGSVKVYPNPVTNKVIHLYLNGIKNGNYPIFIYDKTGKLILREEISYNGQTFIDINYPSSISTGEYTLALQTEDPKLLSTQILIQ